MVGFLILFTSLSLSALSLSAASLYTHANASGGFQFADYDKDCSLRVPASLDIALGGTLGELDSLYATASYGYSLEIGTFSKFISRPGLTKLTVGIGYRHNFNEWFSLSTELGIARETAVINNKFAGKNNVFNLNLTPRFTLLTLETQNFAYELSIPVNATYNMASWTVSVGVGFGFYVDRFAKDRGLSSIEILTGGSYREK